MNTYPRVAAIAAAAIIADQLTKLAATNLSSAGPVEPEAWGAAVFSIVPVPNDGVTGGLAVPRPDLLPAVTVVALVVLLGVSRRVTAGSTIGAALALAGAAGNLLDRLRVGHVIDFLSVNIGPAQVVLNLADVALFIGLPMLVLAARTVDGDASSTGMGRSADSRVPAAGGS